ncbi:MAG: ABC-2 family transporter protein [Deltaproteobacteria bacterium]|nr:ABC-2 family transporter protein [Deltaproteobacteria bacterium]
MRYLRLLSIFYRNSLYTEMEYRANFIANFFMSAFWLAFAILGLHVFFYHRDQIGAWGYYEAMLVVGFYSLFNGLIEALLQPNLSRVIEQIRMGTFDFVLIKPVNSQFMASLRHLSIWKLADVAMGLGICVYAMVRLGLVPSMGDLIAGAGFVLCGAVILYSIWLMMVTSAFWFVRIDNISELFTAIYETGRFPVSVYPSWMRGVLTFVVPIAFITTFPAAALLGRAKVPLLWVALLLAAGLFCGCVCFWRYAVKRYSSASS